MQYYQVKLTTSWVSIIAYITIQSVNSYLMGFQM